MFKTLWKIASGVVKRKVKSYNVANRADKVLSYEKPVAAPRHPGTVSGIVKNNLEAESKSLEETKELLERLKEVKVVSDEQPKLQEKLNDRVQQLPHNREVPEVPTYGYHEPAVIVEGKCSLRQALEFISNHQSDPQKWTLHAIADKYKMDLTNVEHVTKNFRTFEIHFSQDGKKKRAVALSTLKVLGVPNVSQTPALKTSFGGISKKDK